MGGAESALRVWPESNAALDAAAPWPGGVGGVRWCVDARLWAPGRGEWDLVVALLPPSERDAVARFKFFADRKRAVVSRLLQRRCAHEALGVAWVDVDIRRTAGRKPFEARAARPQIRPNFNFNVAHEGDLVVLASDDAVLVGIDVSAPFEVRGSMGSFDELRVSFGAQFTDDEWEVIQAAPDKVAAFRTQWALKEAFTKARGDGLGFDFARVEFCACSAPRAAAAAPPSSGVAAWACGLVDGEGLEDWSFVVYELPRRHVVAVARGPADAVQDKVGEFRSTFGRPVGRDELHRRLATTPPPFVSKHVRDLVPDDQRALYDEARAWSAGLAYDPDNAAAAATFIPPWG
mmetsp:Transcript_5511/g.19550  ORF Transcript_5511/g.19550 Transcript_5511/m.19550 type:complete len:348 (-) Transcript_5511:60-1103(-)